MVGRAIAAINAHDHVVLDVVGHQATYATKRAHRIHFFVNDLRADLRLRHQGTRWAGLHAFAASHTGAVAHGIVQVKHNFTVRAAHRVADDVIDLLFAAGAHAAVALNAGIQIDRHGRVRDVGLGLLAAQGLQLGAHGYPKAIRPFTQLTMLANSLDFNWLSPNGIPIALSLSKGPLVAHIRHIGQQHLHHHLLALEGAFTVGLYFHTGLGITTAAWCQDTLAFDFHHAGAAVAVCAVAILVAKMRNINAVALGGLEDGFPFVGVDGVAVKLEFDRLRQNLNELCGSVHLVSPWMLCSVTRGSPGGGKLPCHAASRTSSGKYF